MNERHEPDPQFLAHLEWQTRTTVRRATRFAANGGDAGARRGSRSVLVGLRVAALALLCALGGGGVVLAAQELERRGDRTTLLAEVELRLELQRTRREGVQAQLERVRAGIDAGVTSTTALIDPEARDAEIAHAIRILELDRDEIEATGAAPDPSIVAAVVDDTDFVLARLTADLQHESQGASRLNRELSRTRALFDAGRIPDGEVARVAANFEDARSQVELTVERIRLRLTYVHQGLTERECRLMEQILFTRHSLRQVSRELKRMQEERVRNRKKEEAGIAPVGSWPTESDLEAAAIEVELLKRYLEELRAELGEEVELDPLPEELKGLFEPEKPRRRR